MSIALQYEHELMTIGLKQSIDEKKIPVVPTAKITTINVEKIPCYCSIGIDNEEKKLGQKLAVDVYVDIDSSSAVNSDNVKSTFSYVDIYRIVQDIGKSKSHSLIETLAEEIVNELLKQSLVQKVKVKVHKPHIPYPEFQGNVSVEVERKK